MGNICRFVINAIGKNGELYYTQCRDKEELKHWLKKNQHKIFVNDLKVIDKEKNPTLRWLTKIELRMALRRHS
ncbi:hypothetical protein ACFSFW_10490 [Fredinandcohnia salidurans]|uniref:Uncharacterized protein n=1 Tax=Fredinandcohnia salidurans TaxID=2595041 RepID=A0ABW4MQ47_9BACI